MVIAGVLSAGGATAMTAKVFGRRKKQSGTEEPVDPGATDSRTINKKENQK